MSDEFNSQAVLEHQRELADAIQERSVTKEPGGKSWKGTATAPPEELRAAAIRVLQRLQEDGHEAYFAGGWIYNWDGVYQYLAMPFIQGFTWGFHDCFKYILPLKL